jgi:LysR family hydrogen peroxide-inducible transcriptional activator
MNLKDLEYFIAVAQTKHFGRAATQCHVAQPTLSAQLKKLEQSLEVLLFERSQKNVMLTVAGAQLLPYAQKVLMQVKELQAAAQQLTRPDSGSLTLGLIPTIAPYLLPTAAQRLNETLPAVKWIFEERQTQVGVQKLLQGDLDAMVMAKLQPIPGTIELKLGYESFKIALPEGHPLTKQKVIKLDQLQGEPLLLLEEGHCLREQTQALCEWLKQHPQRFAGTSLETLRQMVVANAGITVIPAMAAIPTPGIVYRAFQAPEPGREIILLCRDSYTRFELIKKIQSILSERLKVLAW